MFTAYMQRSTAGNQDLEVGANREQFRKPRCWHHHLFKVVEQQQQVLVSQICFQEVEQRFISGLFQSKFLSDGRDNKIRVTDGRQGDEANAIGEIVVHLGRYL